MSFLISDAFAQAAPAAQEANPMVSILFFGGMILLFYFLLIRPQSKRAKEHRKMVEALGKGDEVITNGGLLGKIAEVGDQYLTVEIAEGLQVKMQRQAVAAVVPKGTLKAADKE